MRLGNAGLTIVSDGSLRMDGGAIFGIVPKAIWSRTNPTDRKNRIDLGLNCLLIRSGGKNVLVDTGVGTKHNRRMRTLFHLRGGQLVSSLEREGLAPQDIDLVVLTHLHFDHAGGCTRYDRRNHPEPVFPKATHLVQRLDWLEATETSELTRLFYLPEDFLPLEQSHQLELLDGDAELLPGLWVRRTGGHTAGHQMVYLESAGEKAACLGDVLPLPEQLPVHYRTSYDLYPTDTLEAKRHWLARAEQENWLLVFGHGTDQKAGYLTRREGRLSLLPYDINGATSTN